MRPTLNILISFLLSLASALTINAPDGFSPIADRSIGALGADVICARLPSGHSAINRITIFGQSGCP